MFKFKYKRGLFWRTVKVQGYSLQKEDRMALYLLDGTIFEICQWSKCDCYLGKDYLHHLHKKMEQESGTTIPVDFKNKSNKCS